jgi:diguanylate cyclase (GGDEF)-like protein/putative nucleotidyltransferase with HDIG domain
MAMAEYTTLGFDGVLFALGVACTVIAWRLLGRRVGHRVTFAAGGLILLSIVHAVESYMALSGLWGIDAIEITHRVLVLVGFVWLFAGLVAVTQGLLQQHRALEGALSALEREHQLAITDPLTGLANHRGATAHLQQALERAKKQGDSMAIILGDIDGLKRLNDTCGHVQGDDVIKLVADCFRRFCGPNDLACRYGGDEYLLLLPGKTREDAIALADDIASAIRQIEFKTAEGDKIPFGMSLGVATFPQDAATIEKLVVAADSAMYEAKRGFGLEARSQGDSYVRASAFAVLDGLVQAVDARDRYTSTHSNMAAEYATKLAARLGLSDEVSRGLRVACLLHDVGKLVVPDEILKKPSSLSDSEYDAVKRHVLVGETLIGELPRLTDVVQAVASHHERYDGTGYPRGIAGEEIPILGRIIALADAYAAMTLDRPYRNAMDLKDIVAELASSAGTQFDPQFAKVFVELLLEEASQQKAA